MAEWLRKFRAPRFYRYFFYRMYVQSKAWGNIQPAFSAILLISSTILFQILAIIVVLDAILKLGLVDFLFDGGPLKILIIAFLILLVCYFFFYRNRIWSDVLEEFDRESEKQRILGKYYLFIYLFISLLGLFPITFWLEDLLK